MIYLDHHATTPVLPEVWETMRPFLTDSFGNASSSHAFGRKARQALENAREQIAHFLDAFPDEVIFTSGATEANNLALFGLAGNKPAHILTSSIEHPCVVEPIKQLESRGFDVGWLPVQPNGSISVEAIVQRARPDTRLLALMLVNHETGAIQPVAELSGRLAQCAIHTDAAQAIGKTPVRFHELGATSLSVSGHKLGAPQGIGALLLRRGASLSPLIFGGHQQQKRRPGTEPIGLAVALAKAIELGVTRLDEHHRKLSLLREFFLSRLSEAAPIVVNSPPDGSPSVLNVSFPGCRADLLLMKLDLAGVACSTGSACSSGSLLPSPVLQAMGVEDGVLRSAMRFSFSSQMIEEEIGVACDRIIMCVKKLRSDPP